MSRYTGITIGPIFETINMASTPAALWAASYMFSFISKTLCEKLVESGVPVNDIIAPYYEKDDELISKNNAMGLFHDRIIVRSEHFDIDNFDTLRREAIEKTGQLMGLDAEYLDEYIMISAAEFEAENPIAESGRVLDCLELASPYVFCEHTNPLMTLFTGGEVQTISRNSAIKKIAAEFEKFPLWKDSTTLKDTEDIAGTGTGKKKYRYFAIVRSDGDNTNKIIGTLDVDKQRGFSKDCLVHCSRIAQLVEEFNGVTIYSGGDDLLAILPCESRDGKTLFEFAKRANDMYVENFGKYGVNSTLSFGIAVTYYKAIMADALTESARLLFDIAKTRKNGVAISVRKNSGQTDSIFVSNDCLDRVVFLQKLAEAPVKEGDVPVGLADASEIGKRASIFRQCTDKESITNLFQNFFASKKNDFWHKAVPEIYADMHAGLEIKAITENGISDDVVQAFAYLLRIIKFFTEKGAAV